MAGDALCATLGECGRGLIAYCHQPKKPAITLLPEDMALLNECHEEAMMLV